MKREEYEESTACMKSLPPPLSLGYILFRKFHGNYGIDYPSLPSLPALVNIIETRMFTLVRHKQQINTMFVCYYSILSNPYHSTVHGIELKLIFHFSLSTGHGYAIHRGNNYNKNII